MDDAVAKGGWIVALITGVSSIVQAWLHRRHIPVRKDKELYNGKYVPILDQIANLQQKQREHSTSVSDLRADISRVRDEMGEMESRIMHRLDMLHR